MMMIFRSLTFESMPPRTRKIIAVILKPVCEQHVTRFVTARISRCKNSELVRFGEEKQKYAIVSRVVLFEWACKMGGDKTLDFYIELCRS